MHFLKGHPLKVVALFLAHSLVFSSISWAAPQVSAAAVFRDGMGFEPFVERLEIPEDYGAVKERFVSSEIPSGLSVIHIEDAHSSVDAQKNIHFILEALARQKKVPVLFVEGAVKGLDPSLIRYFSDSSVNAKMAGLMLKDGILSGAEYFLFRQPGTIVSPGIEEAALYRANLAAYREVYRDRDVSAAGLDRLKARIRTAASRIFSRDLREFFRGWMFSQDVPGEWMRQADTLGKYALSGLQLDLEDPHAQLEWPQLVRFFRLRALEKKCDPAKSTEELGRLIEWLEANGAEQDRIAVLKGWKEKRRFTGADVRDLRSFLERLHASMSGKGFTFRDYPELSREFGLAVLSSEIHAEELFGETERLTDLVLGRLAGDPGERELVSIYTDYLLLKKLLSLELAAGDYARVLSRAGGLRPSELSRRLALLSKEKDAGTADALDAAFGRALGFYETAARRDRTIFERMISKMKELRLSEAVLVTGGFHSTGLHELFRQNAVSYADVVPHISDPGSTNSYTDLLTMKPVPARSYVPPERITDLDGLDVYAGPYADRLNLMARDAGIPGSFSVAPGPEGAVYLKASPQASEMSPGTERSEQRGEPPGEPAQEDKRPRTMFKKTRGLPPLEQRIAQWKRLLAADIDPAREWRRIVGPAEAEEFERTWKPSEAAEKAYSLYFNGESYVIPASVYEKMAAWANRSRRHERNGYFIAARKGGRNHILDFKPMPSLTRNITPDPGARITQMTYSFKDFRPMGLEDEVARGLGLIADTPDSRLTLPDSLDFEKIRAAANGQGQELVQIPFHSHHEQVAEEAHRYGPSPPDKREAAGVSALYWVGSDENGTGAGLYFYDSESHAALTRRDGLPVFLDNPRIFPLTGAEKTLGRPGVGFPVPADKARYLLYLGTRLNPEARDLTFFYAGTEPQRFFDAYLLGASRVVTVHPRPALDFQRKRIEQAGGRITAGPKTEDILDPESGRSVRKISYSFTYRGRQREYIQYLSDPLDTDFWPPEAERFDVYFESWFRANIGLGNLSGSYLLDGTREKFNARVLEHLKEGGAVIADAAGKSSLMYDDFAEAAGAFEAKVLPYTYAAQADYPVYLAFKTAQPDLGYGAVARAGEIVREWDLLINGTDLIPGPLYEKIRIGDEEQAPAEGGFRAVPVEIAGDARTVFVPEEYVRTLVDTHQKYFDALQEVLREMPVSNRGNVLAWLRNFFERPVARTKHYLIEPAAGKLSSLQRRNLEIMARSLSNQPETRRTAVRNLIIVTALDRILEETLREKFRQLFPEAEGETSRSETRPVRLSNDAELEQIWRLEREPVWGKNFGIGDIVPLMEIRERDFRSRAEVDDEFSSRFKRIFAAASVNAARESGRFPYLDFAAIRKYLVDDAENAGEYLDSLAAAPDAGILKQFQEFLLFAGRIRFEAEIYAQSNYEMLHQYSRFDPSHAFWYMFMPMWLPGKFNGLPEISPVWKESLFASRTVINLGSFWRSLIAGDAERIERFLGQLHETPHYFNYAVYWMIQLKAEGNALAARVLEKLGTSGEAAGLPETGEDRLHLFDLDSILVNGVRPPLHPAGSVNEDVARIARAYASAERSEIRREGQEEISFDRAQEFAGALSEIYYLADLHDFPRDRMGDIFRALGREHPADWPAEIREWAEQIEEDFPELLADFYVSVEPDYSNLVFTPDGDGLLILGDSKSGKSSLAATLQKYGYAVAGEADSHYLLLRIPGYLFGAPLRKLDEIRARAYRLEIANPDDRKVPITNPGNEVGLIRWAVVLDHTPNGDGSLKAVTVRPLSNLAEEPRFQSAQPLSTPITAMYVAHKIGKDTGYPVLASAVIGIVKSPRSEIRPAITGEQKGLLKKEVIRRAEAGLVYPLSDLSGLVGLERPEELMPLLREMAEAEDGTHEFVLGDGRWTSLVEILDPAGRPAGGVADFWTVKRNGLRTGLVSVLAMTPDGRVAFQANTKGYLDTSASGQIDIGLTPEEAALKELFEELRLRIPADRLFPLKNPRRADGLFLNHFVPDAPARGYDEEGVFNGTSVTKQRETAVVYRFGVILTPEEVTALENFEATHEVEKIEFAHPGETLLEGNRARAGSAVYPAPEELTSLLFDGAVWTSVSAQLEERRQHATPVPHSGIERGAGLENPIRVALADGELIREAVDFIDAFQTLNEEGADLQDDTGDVRYHLVIPKPRGDLRQVDFNGSTILSAAKDFDARETRVPVWVEISERLRKAIGVDIALDEEGRRYLRLQIFRRTGRGTEPVSPGKLVLDATGRRPADLSSLLLKASVVSRSELERISAPAATDSSPVRTGIDIPVRKGSRDRGDRSFRSELRTRAIMEELTLLALALERENNPTPSPEQRGRASRLLKELFDSKGGMHSSELTMSTSLKAGSLLFKKLPLGERWALGLAAVVTGVSPGPDGNIYMIDSDNRAYTYTRRDLGHYFNTVIDFRPISASLESRTSVSARFSKTRSVMKEIEDRAWKMEIAKKGRPTNREAGIMAGLLKELFDVKAGLLRRPLASGTGLNLRIGTVLFREQEAGEYSRQGSAAVVLGHASARSGFIYLLDSDGAFYQLRGKEIMSRFDSIILQDEPEESRSASGEALLRSDYIKELLIAAVFAAGALILSVALALHNPSKKEKAPGGAEAVKKAGKPKLEVPAPFRPVKESVPGALQSEGNAVRWNGARRSEVRPGSHYVEAGFSQDSLAELIDAIKAGTGTYAMLKPDTLERREKDAIIAELLSRGIDVREFPPLKLSREEIEEFYSMHRDKSFFGGLVEYIESGEVIPLFLRTETPDAIARARAAIEDIRKKYAPGEKTKNRIHGSDTIPNAKRETEFIAKAYAVRAADTRGDDGYSLHAFGRFVDQLFENRATREEIVRIQFNGIEANLGEYRRRIAAGARTGFTAEAREQLDRMLGLFERGAAEGVAVPADLRDMARLYTQRNPQEFLAAVVYFLQNQGEASRAYRDFISRRAAEYLTPAAYVPAHEFLRGLAGMLALLFSREPDMEIEEQRPPEGALDPSEAGDPRPVQSGLLAPVYVNYAMAVKEVINPDDRDLTALYGGSGADISSFLLSTNATRGVFVDQRRVSAAKFMRLPGRDFRLAAYEYREQKLIEGYAITGQDGLRDIEANILTELQAIGVDMDSLRMTEEDGGVRLDFEWNYHAKEKKKYSILFLRADITRPETYPPELIRILRGGIDVYYQRAGYRIPRSYPDFLGVIASSLNPGGFWAADDWALSDASKGIYYEYPAEAFFSHIFPYVAFTRKTTDRIKAAAQAIRDFRTVMGSRFEPDQIHYGWDTAISRKSDAPARSEIRPGTGVRTRRALLRELGLAAAAGAAHAAGLLPLRSVQAQSDASLTMDYRMAAESGNVRKVALVIERYLGSAGLELNPEIRGMAEKGLLHFAGYFTANLKGVSDPEPGKADGPFDAKKFAQMKEELKDFYGYWISEKGKKTQIPRDMLAASARVLEGAALDEAGYARIADTGDVYAVAEFVRKTAESLGLQVTDDDHLVWFSRWYTAVKEGVRNPLSGKKKQTFEDLKKELPAYAEKEEWIRKRPPILEKITIDPSTVRYFGFKEGENGLELDPEFRALLAKAGIAEREFAKFFPFLNGEHVGFSGWAYRAMHGDQIVFGLTGEATRYNVQEVRGLNELVPAFRQPAGGLVYRPAAKAALISRETGQLVQTGEVNAPKPDYIGIGFTKDGRLVVEPLRGAAYILGKDGRQKAYVRFVERSEKRGRPEKKQLPEAEKARPRSEIRPAAGPSAPLQAGSDLDRRLREVRGTGVESVLAASRVAADTAPLDLSSDLLAALVELIAPRVSEKQGIAIRDAREEIERRIASLVRLGEKRPALLPDAGAVGVITANGKSADLLIMVLAFMAGLTVKGAAKPDRAPFIIAGRGAASLTKNVLEKNLTEGERSALAGIALIRPVPILEVLRDEIARQARSGQAVSSSLTEEEKGPTEGLLDSMLAALDRNGRASLDGLDAAEAIVERQTLLNKLAAELRQQAQTLKRKLTEAEKLRKISDFFLQFPELENRWKLNPDGTVDLSLADVSAMLTSLRAAQEASAQSA